MPGALAAPHEGKPVSKLDGNRLAVQSLPATDQASRAGGVGPRSALVHPEDVTVIIQPTSPGAPSVVSVTARPGEWIEALSSPLLATGTYVVSAGQGVEVEGNRNGSWETGSPPVLRLRASSPGRYRIQLRQNDSLIWDISLESKP